MSWSLSVTKKSRDELSTALFETAALGNDDCPDEKKAQVEAARAAAYVMAYSGVVGKGPFNVNACGHANPKNERREGWSPDTISVQVVAAY